MAIGNLHRMTPEEQEKALGKKPEEKPEETKPEKKKKY